MNDKLRKKIADIIPEGASFDGHQKIYQIMELVAEESVKAVNECPSVGDGYYRNCIERTVIIKEIKKRLLT